MLWLTKLSYDADREISVFLTSPLRCCVYLCENVYAVPSEVLQIVPDATVPQLSKFLNSHVQRKRVFVKRLNSWRVITWYGRARPWKKACKIWCSMFTFILFIRYRFLFFFFIVDLFHYKMNSQRCDYAQNSSLIFWNFALQVAPFWEIMQEEFL